MVRLVFDHEQEAVSINGWTALRDVRFTDSAVNVDVPAIDSVRRIAWIKTHAVFLGRKKPHKFIGAPVVKGYLLVQAVVWAMRHGFEVDGPEKFQGAGFHVGGKSGAGLGVVSNSDSPRAVTVAH